MTKDETTRLAVLETKLDLLVISVDQIKRQNEETSKAVNALDARINGQRAFAFGVIGAASTIAGFVGWALAQFKERIFG